MNGLIELLIVEKICFSVLTDNGRFTTEKGKESSTH